MKKTCTACGQEKRLDEFHLHPSGALGRHSQCRACVNGRKREANKMNPAKRRARNLQNRYGLSLEQWDEKLRLQRGKCAICGKEPRRPVLDHDHSARRSRGVLCHGCNIKLPAIEDAGFRARALRYLRKYRRDGV